MTRNLPWRAPLTVVLIGVSLAFLALGLRVFLFPSAAAATFGAATDVPEALVFVKAYGARNIAISLIACALIRLDLRAGLVALLSGAALVALLDTKIMFDHAGVSGSLRHLVYFSGLTGLALVTFLSDPRRQRVKAPG